MKDSCITSETVKLGRREYTIKLWPDYDVESPIEEDVFITCNKSSRSQYGNTPLDEDAHELVGRRIELFSDPDAQSRHDLSNALKNEDDTEELGEPLIGLPVYVYEHGNVSMRTRAFSCPWDSGQSGFIYITKETALGWQGGKRLTKAKLDRVYKSLESIAETYGQWCNGECYYYTIEDENGDDIGESCGGFIGYEYAMQEAKSTVEHHHKWRVKEACAKRIAVAKE